MSAEQKEKPTAVYKGYEIRLTPELRFAVTGIGFAEEAVFPSIEGAKLAIDKTIRIVAKKKTLALPIMNGAGKVFEITGINLHTQCLTTRPPTERHYPWSNEEPDDNFYPHVQTVKPLIAKVKELLKSLRTAELELAKFEIRANRGRVSPETYADELEALTKEHAAKTAAAEKLAGKKSIENQ
jgi:hypothetical protein